MATYDRLLLSTDGGIQDECWKAQRQDGLSICIGLGGTGKDAIKQLKREVYRNLRPDDPDSPVLAYGNIKFLVVDCDASGLGYGILGIDRNTEYFDISTGDISAILRSPNTIQERKELSWLNYEQITICGDYYYPGMGGVRHLGRFCLINKAEKFRSKLKALIQETSLEAKKALNIHIFSGICGMTGGGSFLDVCYIIRHVLTEMDKADARITGHFFLPDVTLSIPTVGASPLCSEHVKKEGYAALKELDYLMNLKENHDRFVQNYGSFEIDTNRAPVDCCNLISCTGHDGTYAANGYDGYNYALSVAADYVISLLTKSSSSTDSPAPVQMPAQRKRRHGAVYKYNFMTEQNPESMLWDPPADEVISKAGNNRITVIKMYQGLPLYAWQGLMDLEKTYEKDFSRAGIHLYERGDADWREYLPSPLPASLQIAGHRIPRIMERNTKLTKELEEAKQSGIVFCDWENQVWHIKRSKTSDLPSLSEEVHNFLTDGKWDMVKLYDLLDQTREAREQMYADDNVEEIFLNVTDAENGREEIVLSDDYLRCPALQKIIREELEKVRSLEKEISVLEDMKSREAFAARARETFFNAVFTGVIRLQRAMITFSYDQSGMEQTLVLQNASMPYGTKAPLYQAYLTYEKLDSDMMNLITEKANDAINNMNDEIYEISKQVQARYSPDFLKMTLSRVARDPKRKEIQDFYNEFMKALYPG